MSPCAKLCRTRQNRRDTTADGLKNQPQSHHRQLLHQPDCCCRARRTPPAPRFPHKLDPAPRGLLLGRFFNAGRHRPSRHRHAAAHIEKPSPFRLSLVPPEGREKALNPGFTQTPIVSAFKSLAISSRRLQGSFPDAAGFAMRYTPRPPRPRRRHRLLG